MSFADFCLMTPEELDHVFIAYNTRVEDTYKDGWERTRMLATICVQPHLKRKVQPRQLLPLPWDNKKKPYKRTETVEHQRKRAHELAKNLGLDGKNSNTKRNTDGERRQV